MRKSDINYLYLEEFNFGNKDVDGIDISDIFNKKLFKLIMRMEKDIFR